MERLTVKPSSGLIHLKNDTEMTMNMAIKKLSDMVGNTVYIIKNGEILRNYIVQIHIAETEAQTFFSCYDYCFGIEQVGKTVFLSKEEAENILKIS